MQLEKDDPLLSEQKELKASIKKIKENLKQTGLGPAEGKKLDEELRVATKELEEVEQKIKAKLKKLMDEAIAKADARRAAAAREKEKKANNKDPNTTKKENEEEDGKDDKIDENEEEDGEDPSMLSISKRGRLIKRK